MFYKDTAAKPPAAGNKYWATPSSPGEMSWTLEKRLGLSPEGLDFSLWPPLLHNFNCGNQLNKFDLWRGKGTSQHCLIKHPLCITSRLPLPCLLSPVPATSCVWNERCLWYHVDTSPCSACLLARYSSLKLLDIRWKIQSVNSNFSK